MRSPSVLGRLFFFACLNPVAAAVASASPALPCGVADPGGRTGFVANAHGGIDAVDLATGDLLWSAEAKRPALAEEDRLYAWSPVKEGGIRVEAFDRAQHGRRLMQSETITLPEWINVEEGPGRSFRARWRLDKGSLVLDWEARAWPVHAAGTPETEIESAHQAEGRARVDEETGKVQSEQADKPAGPPAPPKELEKAVVRWQGAAGDGRAALVLDDEHGQQKMSLWSWNAGGAKQPKELLSGRRLLAMPTIDERFVCVRDAAAAGQDLDGGWGERLKCGWAIFAVDGGERLAQVPYEPGTESIAVVGTRAFFLVTGAFKGPIDKPFTRARSLKAFDLRSGKELWEHPVEGKACSPPP